MTVDYDAIEIHSEYKSILNEKFGFEMFEAHVVLAHYGGKIVKYRRDINKTVDFIIDRVYSNGLLGVKLKNSTRSRIKSPYISPKTDKIVDQDMDQMDFLEIEEIVMVGTIRRYYSIDNMTY